MIPGNLAFCQGAKSGGVIPKDEIFKPAHFRAGFCFVKSSVKYKGE